MVSKVSNLLNFSQAAEAVGVTRKTLYSHINKGLISVTGKDGKRFIDVSELIRHYGNVSLPVSKVNEVTRSQSKHDDDVYSAMRDMQSKIELLHKTLTEQSESMSLLLEDKLSRKSLEEELINLKRINDEMNNENENIRRELDSVKNDLEVERGKGFFQRVFKK